MNAEKDRHNYNFAPLSEQQMEALRKAEEKLNMEAGKEIIVLAYEKEK